MQRTCKFNCLIKPENMLSFWGIFLLPRGGGSEISFRPTGKRLWKWRRKEDFCWMTGNEFRSNDWFRRCLERLRVLKSVIMGSRKGEVKKTFAHRFEFWITKKSKLTSNCFRLWKLFIEFSIIRYKTTLSQWKSAAISLYNSELACCVLFNLFKKHRFVKKNINRNTTMS